ncbi:protein PHOSPHATE-INDUCED 1 homolog [Physcomitrium patens]|uniref:Uncharacterized protein n=1 Tax=Physcomitrium patens TaxID=3218 RepID=A0A2K1J220_PHYPA|nr:protein EXORDIUM-like 1 [Physcomitrium patens]PNR35576.1 hypothetical protein PHYPA_023476 [Physcomitrium patens]|eukprot:XP_024403071.1 protein EXORDIUM-like 1 [Physcomitrella patens]
MAPQLERSASTVRESMAAFQRSASSVKLDCSSNPILQRTNSMLSSETKLKAAPSTLVKDQVANPAIRNRNVVIGLLSCLLILAVSWHSMSPEGVPADSFDAGSGQSAWSHGGRAMPYKEFVQKSLVGGMKFLVQDPQIKMTYHNGPLLTGTGGVLKVNVIFYGGWSEKQKAILTDFVRSFSSPKPRTLFPTVAGWWAILKNYKDSKKVPVAATVTLGKVYTDSKYSLKKSLAESDIEKLVVASLNSTGVDPNAVYLVLTSADVGVQGFCSSLCGTHSWTRSPATQHKVLPFVWVGNPATQCPGHCAWPYAKAEYGAGPNTAPLKAPNGDVGVDGMCISIAGLLAGAATNPRNNGYYQGGALDPLEVATVCGGIYGEGAYPGYAGKILKDRNGASYNVNGVNGRKYLVPFVFDLRTKKCGLQG